MSSSSPARQATISRYFTPSPTKPTKRPSSPIDLTLDDDSSSVPPPKKRLKSNTEDRGPKESYGDASATSVRKPVKRRKEGNFRDLLKRDNSVLLDSLGSKPGMSRPSESRNVEHNVLPPLRPQRDNGDDGFEAFQNLVASTKPSLSKAKRRKISPGQSEPRTKSLKGKQRIGPSGETYTPLELQVLELKEANPGIVLMFHVGYKYQFYGEDAKLAAEEFGIACYPKRNFDHASVPVHRRELYLRKFLSKGLKVGIVAQTETAALKKAGENSSKLFKRAVTELYTKHTFLDEVDSVDQDNLYTAPTVLFIREKAKQPSKADDQVQVSVLAITASTGEVLWDEFLDSHMRIELESRLSHANASQILLPRGKVSAATEKLVDRLSTGIVSSERLDVDLTYTEAYDFLTKFYADEGQISTDSPSGIRLASITGLPHSVVILVAHAVQYLHPFDLSKLLLHTSFFARYTTRTHMLLSASTLTNLEVYVNETDKKSTGSLIAILDRTKTAFGARLLRNWIGRPLVDTAALNARVAAVNEILRGQSSDTLIALRNTIEKLPDLARALSRMQFGKITPREFARFMQSLEKLSQLYEPYEEPSSVNVKSEILQEIIHSISCLRTPVTAILSEILLEKAEENLKHELWRDSETYPRLNDFSELLAVVEFELKEELKQIRQDLKMPSLKWSKSRDDDYLVEIEHHLESLIPNDWTLHSRTRYKAFYYKPSVREKIHERDCHREAMEAEADDAFQDFLRRMTDDHYEALRHAVNKIAAADCLFSLSRVAQQEDYVRPEFTDEDVLVINGGRHPMIEQMHTLPYVDNDVHVGGSKQKALVCTGPNMGGKSSAVKMVALLCLMSQIGSYVPASQMKLRTLDGIYTRMGASDNLAKGKSTFMVEMTETSDILRSATERSLVILDELGRGTSTHDGMAIAYAVLQHLIEQTKCKTLFITHYPLIASELERLFSRGLQNSHMAYRETTASDGSPSITFLYKLVPGLTTRSFGVECARLAHVPRGIIETASAISSKTRDHVDTLVKKAQARATVKCLRNCLKADQDPASQLGNLTQLRQYCLSSMISPLSNA